MKKSNAAKIETSDVVIIERGDDTNDEVCENLEREILKKFNKEYFYLDAVAKKDQGHIGFCTYRNN